MLGSDKKFSDSSTSNTLPQLPSPFLQVLPCGIFSHLKRFLLLESLSRQDSSRLNCQQSLSSLHFTPTSMYFVTITGSLAITAAVLSTLSVVSAAPNSGRPHKTRTRTYSQISPYPTAPFTVSQARNNTCLLASAKFHTRRPQSSHMTAQRRNEQSSAYSTTSEHEPIRKIFCANPVL